MVIEAKWAGFQIRRAVVPVAGRGSRLWPASLAVPKALFPIIDPKGIARTVLDLILDELQHSGVTEVCLVTGPGEEDIYRRYLDRATDHGFGGTRPSLTYAVQKRPEGYGHAVWCGSSFVGDEPALVVLGDHIFQSATRVPCVRQVIDAFAQYGVATSGVTETPEAEIGGFGTVAADPIAGDERSFRVTAIVEKPSVDFARAHLRVPGLPSGRFLTWFGIHAMTPRLFAVLARDISTGLRERGEFQLTGAQARVLAVEPYVVTKVDGVRFDTGDPMAWLATVRALHPAHPT